MSGKPKKYFSIPFHHIFDAPAKELSARGLWLSFIAKKFAWPTAKLGLVAGVAIVGLVFIRDTIPLYHNHAIKQKTAFGIFENQSKIQGSIAGGLRAVAPSQGITSHLYPYTNCIKSNYSVVNNKTLCGSALTPIQLLRPEKIRNGTCRCFHSQNSDEPKVARHVAYNEKRRQDGENSDEGSKFLHVLKNGILTTVFVSLMFGLSDIKQHGNDFENLLLGFEKKFYEGQIKMRGHINRYDLETMSIIGVNIIVYLMWNVQRLQETMQRSFLINPTMRPATFVTFISSAFSHSNIIHLFVNMFILNSFINAWTTYAYRYRQSMPKDYMSAKKLSAFYVSAAAVSGFASHTLKILAGFNIPSLGASGAVFALLAYVCFKSPDSRLSIIFLPQWSFSAASGLKTLILFDAVGLAVNLATRGRFMFLDHAGHLGGALFGLWYAKYGEAFLHRWSKCVSRHLKSSDDRRR